MLVLLDSDVVLDFLLKRPRCFADADAIMVHLQNRRFSGFVSSITPVNAFYTCRKELGIETAFTVVKGLLRLVHVASADKAVLTRAFDLGFTDYEDAVQCASAMAANLDAIVTRNSRDYKASPLLVYNPAEFISLLVSEQDAAAEGS